MNPESIEKYVLKLNGAEGSFPFGPEALVFKVMDKMFALLSKDENPPRFTVKCIPEDGELLTGQFESITPGYHMNKRHWITIVLTGEVSDEMIKKLVDDSYRLIVGKLSKADRSKLETQ